jgi:chromosome segregation ATPase
MCFIFELIIPSIDRMKPDILSKKRLKKIEEALHVERNKLELASKFKKKEAVEEKSGKEEVIEKWDQDLEQLTSKLRNLRESAPAGGELGRVKKELVETNTQIIELEAALKDRNGKLEEFGREIWELDSKGKREKKRLENELGGQKDKLKEKERDLKDLKKSLEKSHSNLEKSLWEGEKEAKSLRERIAELDGEIDKRDDELFEKDGIINELKTELKSVGKDLQGLGLEKQQVSYKSESARTKMERELLSLNAQLESRNNEITRLQRNLSESQGALKEKTMTNRGEVKILNEGISKLESLVKIRDKTLKKEIEKSDKLRSTLNRREVELEELNGEKRELESYSMERGKAFENELKRRKILFKSKEKEVQNLTLRLESWHASIRGELDSAIEYITQQSEEINELKAELVAKDVKLKEIEEVSYYRRRSGNIYR